MKRPCGNDCCFCTSSHHVLTRLDVTSQPLPPSRATHSEVLRQANARRPFQRPQWLQEPVELQQHGGRTSPSGVSGSCAVICLLSPPPAMCSRSFRKLCARRGRQACHDLREGHARACWRRRPCRPAGGGWWRASAPRRPPPSAPAGAPACTVGMPALVRKIVCGSRTLEEAPEKG